MADWWTSPLEDESGKLVMVTGRADVDKFRDNPRYKIRIEVTLPYEATPSGMPTEDASKLIDDVLERIQVELERDPVAILTGIYTGAGERNMVFYAASTFIFDKKLNAALADLPTLPLRISAENDPGWEEYAEMRELSEIN